MAEGNRKEVSEDYTKPPDFDNEYRRNYEVDDMTAVLMKIMPNYDWVSDPEMADTPKRFLRMMLELTDRSKAGFNFTTFDNPGTDEMVIIKDIRFVTLCAHHLAPFVGTCHIGYVPGSKIAGLSKFPRLVNFWSKGLWTQEALTQTIANDLAELLIDPVGVAVVMTAQHQCMSLRGVQAHGATTDTLAMKGCFADHAKLARSEFLSRIS